MQLRHRDSSAVDMFTNHRLLVFPISTDLCGKVIFAERCNHIALVPDWAYQAYIVPNKIVCGFRSCKILLALSNFETRKIYYHANQ